MPTGHLTLVVAVTPHSYLVYPELPYFCNQSNDVSPNTASSTEDFHQSRSPARVLKKVRKISKVKVIKKEGKGDAENGGGAQDALQDAAHGRNDSGAKKELSSSKKKGKSEVPAWRQAFENSLKVNPPAI